MKIKTEVIAKKFSSILLGMKVRYKLEIKGVDVKTHNIKCHPVYINTTDLYSRSTYNYVGSIFYRVETILDDLKLSGEVYLTKGRKLYRLLRSDLVYNKCIFYDHQKTQEEPHQKTQEEPLQKTQEELLDGNIPHTTFKMLPSTAIFIINHKRSHWFTSCRNIKKLVIRHSFLQSVSLDDLVNLKHLDLSHNYLEELTLTKKVDYCDLSHNNLSSIDVRAKNLNLSHNNLSFFYSDYRSQVINVSHNPLVVLSASGSVVNVSSTRIQNIFCLGIKKLICCNNRKVKLFNTKDLVYLNLNNCHLKDLQISNVSLKVVKLRNNRLERIPFLGYLEYLDLSGNNIKCVTKYTTPHLNISRNPLRYVLYSNEGSNLDITYTSTNLSINDKMVFRKLIKYGNPTKMSHKYKVMYKVLLNVPRFIFGKVFFVVALNSKRNVGRLLTQSLSRVETKVSNFDFFTQLVNSFESVLRESLCDPIFYSVFIEDTKIYIRSVNLPLVFSSFASHKLIDNPSLYLFENIGKWRIFPILGCSEFIRKKPDEIGSPVDIMYFMDIYCKYTLDLEIKNMTELYKDCIRGIEILNEIPLKSRCPTYRSPCEEKSPEGSCLQDSSYIPTYNIEKCSISYSDHINSSLSESLPAPCLADISDDYLRVHDTNTFVFLKFNSDKNCLKIFPLNHIIGTLCRIFKMVLFEQHDYRCGVFLGFNRLQGLLFAMYLYRILSYKGISLSLGVVCGDYSLRWSLIFPKVFGYGMNKSARYASMGEEGVFCCKCVKLEHKNLVFIPHGEKYMKGFTNRLEVFSVHFVKPFS